MYLHNLHHIALQSVNIVAILEVKFDLSTLYDFETWLFISYVA